MSDSKSISKAASLMGRKGGRAGRGASKARDPEKMRAASRAYWARWRAEREREIEAGKAALEAAGEPQGDGNDQPSR